MERERGGWKGRGNSPFTHLHFYAPPFSPVMQAIRLSMFSVQLSMQMLASFALCLVKLRLSRFYRQSRLLPNL